MHIVAPRLVAPFLHTFSSISAVSGARLCPPGQHMAIAFASALSLTKDVTSHVPRRNHWQHRATTDLAVCAARLVMSVVSPANDSRTWRVICPSPVKGERGAYGNCVVTCGR